MYNDNKVRADDFRVAGHGWMDGWMPTVMTPLDRLDKIPIISQPLFLISLM